jgi:hypothetical protein
MGSRLTRKASIEGSADYISALLIREHIALERLQVARLKITQLIDIELVH